MGLQKHMTLKRTKLLKQPNNTNINMIMLPTNVTQMITIIKQAHGTKEC